MKNILVVEDDSYKSEAIVSLLSQRFQSASINLADNVSSAINLVNEKTYDLIILDMALPSHPAISGGGAPMSLLTGGLEIIFELRTLNRQDPCLIVTQYPDIEICGDLVPISYAPDAIKKHFLCNVISCVLYKEGDSKWNAELLEAIRML